MQYLPGFTVAVHQSAMRSPRPLARADATAPLGGDGHCPVAEFPPQRSPPLCPRSHASPLPHRPPAAAPAATLANELARTSAFPNHGKEHCFWFLAKVFLDSLLSLGKIQTVETLSLVPPDSCSNSSKTTRNMPFRINYLQMIICKVFLLISMHN